MELRPLAGPWQRIAIDVLSGFNTSKKGNTLLLVVMDEYSKWPEVIPLRNQKAETIAEALVQNIFYRFGIPQVMHSDKASNLGMSHICKNVCDLLGISRSFSSAGHPEGNGQVERFNRFLVAGLYCLMNQKQNDWDTQLPALLFAYRTSVHSTTGETPFFLNHGRDPVLPGDILLRDLKSGEDKHKEYARQIMDQQTKIVGEIHQIMEKERAKMKRNHDRAKKKVDISFQVEDPTTLQPADLVSIYYQEPHVVGHSTKFRSTWSIPFRVIRKLDGNVNYEVQSTRDPRKTKIVHVSRMRLYKPWHRYVMAEPGQHIDLSLELPGDLIEDIQPKRLLPNEDYEIDGIIDQYDEGKGKTKKTWYLVTWTGYPEPSWVLSQRVNAKAMVSEWKMKVKNMTKSERAMINVEPASRPGNYKRIALEVSDNDMDNIPDEVNEPLSDDHSDEDSNSDTNDGHKDTSNRKRGRSSK
jgi:transposase InsO family protein